MGFNWWPFPSDDVGDEEWGWESGVDFRMPWFGMRATCEGGRVGDERAERASG